MGAATSGNEEEGGGDDDNDGGDAGDGRRTDFKGGGWLAADGGGLFLVVVVVLAAAGEGKGDDDARREDSSLPLPAVEGVDSPSTSGRRSAHRSSPASGASASARARSSFHGGAAPPSVLRYLVYAGCTSAWAPLVAGQPTSMMMIFWSFRGSRPPQARSRASVIISMVRWRAFSLMPTCLSRASCSSRSFLLNFGLMPSGGSA